MDSAARANRPLAEEIVRTGSAQGHLTAFVEAALDTKDLFARRAGEQAEKQFEVALELAATETAQLREKLEALEREKAADPSCMEAEHGGHPTCVHQEEWLRQSTVEASQLRTKVADLEPWKTAVLDACVVNWTSWNERNPRTTLQSLIADSVTIALDPLVSKAAADLVDRARAAGKADERAAIIAYCDRPGGVGVWKARQDLAAELRAGEHLKEKP